MPNPQKRFRVTARFPDAKAGATIQHAVTNGQSYAAGIHRAMLQFMKRPGIKAKQHRCIEIRIEEV